MPHRPNRRQYMDALRLFAMELHMRTRPEPETPTDWDKVFIQEATMPDDLWSRIDEYWQALEDSGLPMIYDAPSHVEVLQTIAYEMNHRAYIPPVSPEYGPSESDVPSPEVLRDYHAGETAIAGFTTEAELMFFISDLRTHYDDGRGYHW